LNFESPVTVQLCEYAGFEIRTAVFMDVAIFCDRGPNSPYIPAPYPRRWQHPLNNIDCVYFFGIQQVPIAYTNHGSAVGIVTG
jgi:hypothetical protein